MMVQLGYINIHLNQSHSGREVSFISFSIDPILMPNPIKFNTENGVCIISNQATRPIFNVNQFKLANKRFEFLNRIWTFTTIYAKWNDMTRRKRINIIPNLIRMLWYTYSVYCMYVILSLPHWLPAMVQLNEMCGRRCVCVRLCARAYSICGQSSSSSCPHIILRF